ncbi:MAG TPA: hypothetical protein VMQ78_09240 [Candidatus Limnocylindria bacterium]|nr:hypothetical protein [Candidatus Limnocylindria bacterium]
MRGVSGWLPGVILIVIGVTLFAVQLLRLDADVIVLIVGLVLAIAYAATRRYGLLIPAGILSGLGTGILLEDLGARGEPVVLGLGLGFLAIFGVDLIASGARERGRWWPLVPGTILTIVAGAESTFGAEGKRLIEQAWPVLLIALGAWLLVRGRASA